MASKAGHIIVLLTLLTAGCSAGSSTPAAGANSPDPGQSPCQSEITEEPLPEWARSGFRDAGTGVPHVFSEQGDLVAVLFSHPLVASTDPEVTNKILWVSQLPQEPKQPLTIEAVLDGSELTVQHEVPGGPGPSTVNLPEAGCWRLTLSWSGHQDHMMLDFN